MAFVKIVLCLLLLLGLSAVLAAPKTGDHNLYDCPDSPSTSKRVVSKTIEAKGHLLEVQVETLPYRNDNKLITCIVVTDLIANSRGGYVDVLDGGVGFYNVLLQFTSQRSRGYKFYVEIYISNT